MPPTLPQIVAVLSGSPPPAQGRQRAITPWVINSQEVQPGGGFVARPGASAGSTDGHRYIADALRRGAAVVIAEKGRAPQEGLAAPLVDLTAGPPASPVRAPAVLLVEDSQAAIQRVAAWWRSLASPALRVIGITGSVGKTTTKELVAAVLSTHYRTWKSRGNYNSDIGLPLTLLDMPLTCERAVLEMGMTRPNEIRELAELSHPSVGIVTNVGTAHMMQLGSIEAIAAAKGELPAALPPTGVAILNGDDPRVSAMGDATPARVWRYGLQPTFELWADEIVSHGMDGISLRFHRGKEQIAARLPLLGRHSVHGALAAASVGLNEGLGWGEIITGLKNLADLEVLRIVVAQGLNGSTLIDDSYNASPDSVMAALSLLSDFEGRRIAVLGDMRELGPYTDEGHRLVALRAAEVAALFIAVGEQAPAMVAVAREGGMPPDRLFAAASRREAADWLRERLRPGDIVLVKGSRALRLDELVNELSVAGDDL